MEIGEESINNVMYYWALPVQLPRPHTPWYAIVNHNIEIINWSITKFGVPGNKKTPGRWFMGKKGFYFHDQRDRIIFVLKWA
jgi:hypothetical protein